MSLFKKILVTLTTLLVLNGISPSLTLPLQTESIVYAQTTTPATGNTSVVPVAPRGECDPTLTDPLKPQCLQSLGKIFNNILNVVMGLAGFAAFAFLIFGGFKFLTSQGDPKALGAARTTITWALGGLAMIIISYLIILLISNYTGVTQLQKFEIPTPGAGRTTP